MPGRPNLAEQKRVLGALGVRTCDKGTCWTDRLSKAKRHRTAGQTQLEERNALLTAAIKGDMVIVCDPMCLGVSAQDAAWFIEQLAERQVSLTVNGDLRQVSPGDDASDLVADVGRLIRNANTARSRGRV
jgi:hypothetical protein